MAFDVRRTRACAALTLRSLVFGPAGIAMTAFLIGPFAVTAAETQLLEPLLVPAGIAFFIAWVVRDYCREALDDPSLPTDERNLATFLDAELVRSLAHLTEFSTGDVMMAAARSARGSFVLREVGIDASTLQFNCFEAVGRSVECMAFLSALRAKLGGFGEKRIGGSMVIAELLKYVPECRDLLNKANLLEQDVDRIFAWEQLRERRLRAEPWWKPASIKRTAGGLGRSWVLGYTDALDRITEDVGASALRAEERGVLIHKPELAQLTASLERQKNRNALILGKIGVGKRTLVENFIAAMRDNELHGQKTVTRVLRLRTEMLLSGGAEPDRLLLMAFEKAKTQGNFLLVIPDLGLLVRGGSPRLVGVLAKFLEAPSISCIAIASIDDYHMHLKTNPALDSHFERVNVEDATEEETTSVLMAHAVALEHRRHATVTYKALATAATLSRQYLSSRGFPGAAIEIIEESLALASRTKSRFVLEAHVREVVSIKAKVDVRAASSTDRQRLLSLEETLCKRVIGQEEAVRAVANALKRAKVDLGDRKRPIGTFLFLGPTGVGKTQTTKAVAEEYFGSSEHLVRLDMNEYNHPDAVFAIIGSANGQGESQLLKRIQDQPFSVVLLDEIEKAHPNVLNLFLQILDEGVIADAAGRKSDFRNAIIIATSNAGALFIRDYFKAHPEADTKSFREALLEHILQQRIFSPEFVNRFDEVIAFRPLVHQYAAQVATLMLDDIVKEVMEHRGIAVQIEPEVVDALLERGYSVEFGARDLRRTITAMIENQIADRILRQEVKRGEVMHIRVADLKF